jgi:hypothetical protein
LAFLSKMSEKHCNELPEFVRSRSSKRRALFWLKNFERYRAVMPHVVREVDCGHSSAAKLTLKIVPAGEGVAQVYGNPRVAAFPEGLGRRPMRSYLWHRITRNACDKCTPLSASSEAAHHAGSVRFHRPPNSPFNTR